MRRLRDGRRRSCKRGRCLQRLLVRQVGTVLRATPRRTNGPHQHERSEPAYVSAGPQLAQRLAYVVVDKVTVRRPEASRIIRALALPIVPFLAVMFAFGIPLNALGGPDWIIAVALILAFLAYLYGVYRRISKEGVTWNSDTLEIHNAWKSYSIPWSDVSDIDMEKPWWLSLDEGRNNDFYVPVVTTRSGQQVAVAVMYCEGPNFVGETSRKARRTCVDKSEIQSLIAQASSHRGDVPDDLIDASEAAEFLGLAHRNSVLVYKQRYDDFPEPVVSKSRYLLWLRADIEAWRDR